MTDNGQLHAIINTLRALREESAAHTAHLQQQLAEHEQQQADDHLSRLSTSAN